MLYSKNGTDTSKRTIIYIDEKTGFEVDAKDSYLVKKIGRGEKVYSDFDLHGITRADGKPLTIPDLEPYLKKLNEEIGEELELIQHGPQDYWPAVEKWEIAKGNVGPQYGIDSKTLRKKYFTVFLPDGTQRIVEDNASFLAVYEDILKIKTKDGIKTGFEFFYPELYKYYKGHNNTFPENFVE